MKSNCLEVAQKFRLIALLVAGIGVSMTPIHSYADQTSEPSINEPVDIEVAAGRGIPLDAMDVSTKVMNRAEIEKTPATTVDQILNAIPGINISQAEAYMHPTGEGQSLSMRGMGNNTNIVTLVMIDGVPANDPFFKTVNWSQIPKDSIERIEVIKGGGATSAWGNMAMGGVINIVTRAPETDSTHYNVSYGSYNTWSGGIDHGFELSPELKLGISYNGTSSSGYNMTPTNSAYYNNITVYGAPVSGGSSPSVQSIINASTNTGLNSQNVKLRLGIEPNTDSKYTVNAMYNQTNQINQEWLGQNNQWGTYNVSVSGATKTDEVSSINLSAWIGRGSLDIQNTRGPNSTPVNLLALQENESNTYGGASLAWKTNYSDFIDFTVGADYRQIGANNNSNVYNSPRFSPACNGAASGNLCYGFTSSGTNVFGGLFAQSILRPFTIPLEFTVGLRQDYWGAMNGSANTNQSLANQSFNYFDPRVGARYLMTDTMSLRGAIYQNYAAPGMNQMYRTFASGTSLWVANPNLSPEISQGAEIGYDYKQKYGSMSLTAYTNNMKNYIDWYNTSLTGSSFIPGYTGAVRQYANVGNAKFYGAEFDGKLKPIETVTLGAGVSYTKAMLTSTNLTNIENTTGQLTNQQLGLTPTWIFNANANWQATEKLNVDGRIKIIPTYWDNYCQSNCTASGAAAFGAQDGGATIFDLGLAYNIAKQVKIFGVVQNMFNAQYVDNYSSGDPVMAPPRMIYVGFRGDI